MVKVEVGARFLTADFKQGEKDGRKWAMIEAKAEKGYDKITLFTDELCDGEYQELAEIKSITKSARKGTDKNGEEKWYDTYTANVVFKSSDTPSGFSAVLDESIPF